MNRRERRAAAKAEREQARQHIDQRTRELEECGRESVEHFLGQERTPGKVGDLAVNVLGFVQGLIKKVSEPGEPGDPPPLKVACREGCNWCCHMNVDVTAPEVFFIAGHLRDGLPADHVAAIVRHVEETWRQTRNLTRAERQRARIPCSMLVDGRCIVYPVRPLMCRGHNAFDATQCEKALDKPEMAVVGRVADRMYAVGTARGVGGGLADLGLDDGPQELTEGLHVALSKENAVARWLAGEPVFAECRKQEDGDAL